MQTPDDIAHRFLEITGRALDEGDICAFRDCFGERLTLATRVGEREVVSGPEIDATFGRVRGHYQRQRVSRMTRRLLATLDVHADMFVSVHETRLYHGRRLVQEPFKTLSTFRRIDGRWRIVDSCYAISGSPDHERALLGPGAPLHVPDLP